MYRSHPILVIVVLQRINCAISSAPKSPKLLPPKLNHNYKSNSQNKTYLLSYKSVVTVLFDANELNKTRAPSM